MDRLGADQTTAPDLTAARAQLSRVRVRLVLSAIAGLAGGAAGWAWTAQIQWWGVVALGTVAVVAVIPIQRAIRAVDYDIGSGHPRATLTPGVGQSASAAVRFNRQFGHPEGVSLAYRGTQHVGQRHVLYQDARWPIRGRLFYGLLYPLGIIALVGGAIRGDSIGTLAILTAVFGVPVVVCEWRARKMGFMITEDGLELIRALNRSRVPWERVNRFVLRKPSFAVDYGQRLVWIEQPKRGLLPRGSLPVPTLCVTPSDSRLFRWMGPGGIKWEGGRTSDTAAFLDQLLTHRPTTHDRGAG